MKTSLEKTKEKAKAKGKVKSKKVGKPAKSTKKASEILAPDPVKKGAVKGY